MTQLEAPTFRLETLFDRLYAELHAPILQHLRHKVGDPDTAEDLAQDVWAKMAGRLDEYATRPDFNPKALVYATATNRAIDHLRRGESVKAGGRVRFEPLDAGTADAVADALTPEAVAVAAATLRERRALTGVLLEAMPTAERSLLWWAVYGSRSYVTLARWYETTVSAIKARLLRARRRLDAFAVAEAARIQAGRGVVVRFHEHASRAGGPDACWPWHGATAVDARSGMPSPRLSVGGKAGSMVPTRRIAYTLRQGPIPPGIYPLLACGEGRPADCVNPAHVVPGRKTGAGKGTAGGRYVPVSAALAQAPPPEAAELVARRTALGLSQRAMAARVGMPRQTIAQAEMGRARVHIGRGQLARIVGALDRLEREQAEGASA